MRERIANISGMLGLTVGGFLLGVASKVYWNEPLPFAITSVVVAFCYGLFWLYLKTR